MPKMLFQGHSSLRFITNDDVVIFVDPYMGDGYDLPADLILVTHGHFDHSQISLVKQKNDCLLITNRESLINGTYKTFQHKGVVITAVPASNRNHSVDECVGYIIAFDGLSIYCAGDTSCNEGMSKLSGQKLDYALLPIDGVYNMTAEEASKCAKLIDAKHCIPIHTSPDNGKDIRDRFSEENAARFDAPCKLIVRHGETINL